MLRLYDWRCSACGATREHLISVPDGTAPPRDALLLCGCQPHPTEHDRLLSAPAKYLGDRPLNVCVRGGQFDTMGYRPMPRLPEFPDGGAPDDFRDFVSTREYQDVKKQRKRIARENAAKRKRAQALKRGETVSMRHQRLPGDPDLR